MKNKLFKKYLSLILTVLLVFYCIPATVYSLGDSVSVDVIITEYTDDGWKLLYPSKGETTEVSVSPSAGDVATVYDALLRIDPYVTTEQYVGISELLGIQADMFDEDMPLWYCEVDGVSANHTKTLYDGNKILLYYIGMYDLFDLDSGEPSWDTLSALIDDNGEVPVETEITVDIISTRNGYDGWEILYPEYQGGDTELNISITDSNPTLYDAMLAIDPNATLRTNNRIDTFLGLSSGNENTWFGYIGNSVKSTPKTAPLTDGDQITFYYFDGVATRPDWSKLSHLIDNPNPQRTPAQRLSELIETELNFEKIKGNNSAADNITLNLGTLPTRLDTNAMLQANFEVTWTSSNSEYISNTGALQARPASTDEPVTVIMKATLTAGTAYNSDKYGTISEAGLPITVEIQLKVTPLTEEEEEANKLSVKSALDEIKLENLKLMDGSALDSDNVMYDIQLVDPRQYGDKTTIYLPDGYWTSDNTDVIDINWMRGKVTRPAPGEPDEEVTLSVVASKGGYTESKTFKVTVKALTQEEIDTASTEIDAVASALTFDVIKNANISADAVRSNLQMVTHCTDYPATLNWGTSSSGEKGIKIDWETNDASAVTFYGTVTRPTVADKYVTLTATLTPYRLASYIQPRKVEIPLIVRKISNSANVSSISLTPTMNFTFNTATKIYNLSAPSIADSIAITVTTEETGTLITSGQHSARGTLSYEIELTEGQTTVVEINTKALDSENEDTYLINITPNELDSTDRLVQQLITSISLNYKNTSDEWAAVDMAAYGKAKEVAGATIVENSRNTYINGNTTDIARSIITLTSLGVDASKVYSGKEGEYLDFIKKLSDSNLSQIMESTFGLIALDSGDYSSSINRETYINYILNKKITPATGQTAWAITGNTPDVDATAMVVSALAPYYSNTNVKTTINEALKYLSMQQNNSAHYGNANSTSMVIVALTALGKDPGATTGDFAKNGKSLINGLLTFRTPLNRFGYDNNINSNDFSTEQGFRALISYRGYIYSGKKEYNIYQFGAQTGDGSALTGEKHQPDIPTDPSAPKTMDVRIENLYSGKTLIPKTSVKLSGTHLDALKAALSTNGKNPETELSYTNGWIGSILGISGGSRTGWMYAINGEIPITLLNETQIKEGDSLVLFYVDWQEPFYFTMFDCTAAAIKTGQSLKLKLTGINPWDAMENNGVYTPISEATIITYDATGKQIGTDIKTNVDGEATLTFNTVGTYTVSAIKKGNTNATELVAPNCTVIVTSTTSPTTPPSSITAYFTLQGLNSSNNEEIWIEKKAITNLSNNSTVSDVIVKALDKTGYTQVDASRGYVSSVTTPEGFKLAQYHNGITESGWLYKVNSEIPNIGMNYYNIKNGDHILLYFTKNYATEMNTENTTSTTETTLPNEKTKIHTEIETKAINEGDTAIATIDTEIIKEAIKEANEESEKSTETDVKREIKVHITEIKEVKKLQIELKAEALKAIANNKVTELTLENNKATITIDKETIEGIIENIQDNPTIKFIIEIINPETLDNEIKEKINNFPTISIKVIINDTEIHNIKGMATITIPYTPPTEADTKTLKVYYIDSSKNAHPIENSNYDTERKEITYRTNQLTLFYIATETTEWTNIFTDVKESDWFYNAIKYVYTNNLMVGTQADKFSPNKPMTRAMFITVLYRHEGTPEVTTENTFKDVEDEQWYTNAIIWAKENGIIAGYSNNLFGIKDNITREQIYSIIRNHAQTKGLDISKTSELSTYTDANKISTWALTAMKWARAEKLLQDKTETTLNPKEAATRAEAATILMRYIDSR